MQGCSGSHTGQAQSIPDIQWTKSGRTLTVTTDGGIVTTEHLSQQNNPNFPSVDGDRVIKYATPGNVVWQTGLLKGGFYLGGKIPGYDYEALGAILPAGTTDGGVGIVGKTSLRGANVATRIDANGSVRVWQESDIFFGSSTGTAILNDIVGTPDGGYLVMYLDRQTNSSPSQTIIRKYDAAGNFSWAKQIAYPTPNPTMPDNSLTEGKAVINTPDWGYLLVGYYNNSGVVYDPLTSFATNQTGWVAKLDGSGNVAWQKLLTSLPKAQTFNGFAPGSVQTIFVATDVVLATDGNGYALVGPGMPPSVLPSPPTSVAILELDWNGDFKRARLLDIDATQAFITQYGPQFYAVGNTSLGNGADPRVLKVSAAKLNLNDPDLFKVVVQRTFDRPSDGYLKKMERAGDGGLVLITTNQELIKLNADTPLPFSMRAPSYNCQTGGIIFNIIGGDGSPVTYTAPGITRASVTDNFGTVEPGLRNDPKVITITATQSGNTVTYNFDLKAACSSSIPKLPVFNGPIPDQFLTVGQSFPGNGYFSLAPYFTDPNVCFQNNECLPGYVPNWAVEVSGLPSGMNVLSNNLLYAPYPEVVIGGTPNLAGIYTVTVKVSTGAYRDFPIITSFKITVSNNNPPNPDPLALIAPGYDCATGAFTFRTTGGNGSQIEYQAAGITGWTTNPNQFVDKDSRTANDVQPFTLMARQNGNVVTYSWDLKATCSSTPTLKPLIALPIPDQTYTVGQDVYFVLGSYFNDPNISDPNYVPNWSISTSALPASLSLFVKSSELAHTPAVVIVGTATAPGVYTVNVSAHTTAGSASSTFKITITSTSTALALVAPDYDCSTGAITFKTTGGDGTLIEYQAPGITGWTTNPNQFVDKESRTANDVQPFTLMARQSGNVVTYIWDLRATCGRARVGVNELGTGLQIRVLGNPVEGKSADVEISGVAGKAVHLKLVDSRGSLVHQLTINQAESIDRVSVPLGNAQGMLLLQVGTATEQKKIKLLRP
ncbi:Ig domain-containing protein [Spirosoma sp. KNUC1025]|uniref:Ig domain-containing protein n=1 Tax=Spirosoma sp. KNUC1025 TaxID=2894082 RepID=UPI00386396DE|nr:Ig domain-containing protein [Spirosoma sp. KNUC1025]